MFMCAEITNAVQIEIEIEIKVSIITMIDTADYIRTIDKDGRGTHSLTHD